MAEVRIAFTITAAQLNAADTSDITVVSLPSNSRLVRVPVRIEAVREAGDAYTITRYNDTQQKEWVDIYGDFVKRGEFLVVQDEDGLPLFYIRLDNFINRADANAIVVMANTNARTFTPGNSSTFTARATVDLSGGTGSVTGFFVFEEFAPL